jgi:hypothetical protein
MTSREIEAAAIAMQQFDAALASDERPWSELDRADQAYWCQRAKVGLEAAELAGRNDACSDV